MIKLQKQWHIIWIQSYPAILSTAICTAYMSLYLSKGVENPFLTHNILYIFSRHPVFLSRQNKWEIGLEGLHSGPSRKDGLLSSEGSLKPGISLAQTNITADPHFLAAMIT